MRVARILLVTGLLASSGAMSTAHASVVTYTSESAFLAALAGGAHHETFDSLAEGGFVGPLAFSGAGFAYSATAFGDLFPYDYPEGSGDIWMGTNLAFATMTFTVTAGAPTAMGGYFYVSDIIGNRIVGNLTVSVVAGGTPTSFTLANPGLTTFLGFISDDAPFTSLTTLPTAPTAGWGNVDDLIVGHAATVPEPASLTLLGLGLVMTGVRLRRARRRS